MGSPVQDGIRIHTLSAATEKPRGVSGAEPLSVPFTVTGSVSARELSGSPLMMTRGGSVGKLHVPDVTRRLGG